MAHSGITRARTAALAGVAAAAVTVAGAAPVLAATLNTHHIEGKQFVNASCARNEYRIDANITGTTNDVGGFDRVAFRVWDDGTMKDERIAEVAVGTTKDVTAFLTFTGTFGTGAAGVGIDIVDIDGAGNDITSLSYTDPFTPPDVAGPCEIGVERIGGVDRFDTAALLSQRFISATTVLVATSDVFADALAATPLADQVAGPMLLTKPTVLPAKTKGELTRLAPTAIIIVGGTGAVSSGVQAQIQALVPGATIERIAGSDRYQTSAKIAAKITQDSSKQVMLATGKSFADGLVLGAYAARENAPLVLTDGTRLAPSVKTFLEGAAADDLYVAGGTGAVSTAVATEAAALTGADLTRFSGTDRYDTSAKVLAKFPAQGGAFIATGQEFPDALAAVPVAGRTDYGVALSRPGSVPAVVMTQIQRLVDGSLDPQLTIVGGTGAVSDAVKAQLQTTITARQMPAERSAPEVAPGRNIPLR